MGGASKSLTDLVERLNYPVTCTLMGLGAYPGSGEHSLGMLGMHGSYEANQAMHNADLVVSIGARFDDRVTNGTDKFCPGARIVHVDIDPANISKTIKVDVPIVGPVGSVLKDLHATLDELAGSPDQEAIAAWWEKLIRGVSFMAVVMSLQLRTASNLSKPLKRSIKLPRAMHS